MDVRKYEALSGSRCEFSHGNGGIHVSVVRDVDTGQSAYVHLYLVQNYSAVDPGRRIDPHIRCKEMGGQELEAKPRLQPDGEILIEVKKPPPLTLWQFSQLMLEPVFFPNR